METDPKILEERRQQVREILMTSQRSNSETYDRALLQLSSALLAVSIAFISNVVDLDQARWMIVLYGSWALFGGTIVVTLISFMYAQHGIQKQLDAADVFFSLAPEAKRVAADEENQRISKNVDRFNLAAGIVFLLGVAAIITFAIANTGSSMPKEKKTVDRHAQPTTSFDSGVKKGQPSNTFDSGPATGGSQDSGGPSGQGDSGSTSDSSGGSGQSGGSDPGQGSGGEK